MSLIERINADFKQAMLERDEVRKVTLNSLKSAIKYKEVEKGAGSQLSDAEIEAVVAHEVKSRNDSIDVYTQAGDDERAAAERAERDILAAYLPRQLTPEELKTKIAQIIQTGGYAAGDFGRIMGQAKAEIGNAADGAAMAAAVREYFAQ